jgi:hypothetical protein
MSLTATKFHAEGNICVSGKNLIRVLINAGRRAQNNVLKKGKCLTLILPLSRTGTVWFYTSTSNKRAARPKLYTKSLTRT